MEGFSESVWQSVVNCVESSVCARSKVCVLVSVVSMSMLDIVHLLLP